jgi:tetratricopeptide (TPR) repeat protein
MTLSSDNSLLSAVEFTDDGNTLLVGSREAGRNGEGVCQFWHAPSWKEIEDAERIGGIWPQAGAFQPAPPAPTLSATKVLTEAAYWEKLKSFHGTSRDEMDRWNETVENLADLLRQQQRDGEVESLYKEFLEKLKQRVPHVDSAILTATKYLLGFHLAQIQRAGGSSDSQKQSYHSGQADLLVNEVLAIQTRVSMANPEDTMQSLRDAVFEIWFGRKAEHNAIFQHLLERAAVQPPNADAMEHAAAAWCLSPNADPSQGGRALELAQNAANLADTPWYKAWYQRTLALALYRSGRDAESNESLNRACEAAEQFPRPRRQFIPPLQTSVRFIRSMILFRAGKAAEARQLFDEATADMKPEPADHRQIFESRFTLDEALVWLACREAKAVLEVQHPDSPPNQL